MSCLLQITVFLVVLVSVAAGSLDRRRRVPFQIPHSLAFAADKRELLVADRENGRVQCFMADTGEFVKEIKREEFGGEVFAVSYSPAQGNHHIHCAHSHPGDCAVAGAVFMMSYCDRMSTWSETPAINKQGCTDLIQSFSIGLQLAYCVVPPDPAADLMFTNGHPVLTQC